MFEQVGVGEVSVAEEELLALRGCLRAMEREVGCLRSWMPPSVVVCASESGRISDQSLLVWGQ